MTGCDRCEDGWVEVDGAYARCPCTVAPAPVTVMDPDEGARRRDAAVTSVGHNTRADWIAAARRVVRDLCAAGRPFTTDDVWQRIGKPPEPRAMGAVMTWAKGRGYCVPTDRMVPTDRPEGHRGPKRVWMPTDRWRT